MLRRKNKMQQSKFKRYSFWISLISAIVLLAETVADAFGFKISTDALFYVGNAVLGVFVVLGIVVKDVPKDDNYTQKDDKNNKNM